MSVKGILAAALALTMTVGGTALAQKQPAPKPAVQKQPAKTADAPMASNHKMKHAVRHHVRHHHAVKAADSK